LKNGTGGSARALAMAALLALAVGSGWIWKGCAMNTVGQEFDAARWQSGRGRAEDPQNPRSGMIGALESDHLRKGMARDAVRKLLGEPDAASVTTDEYDLGRSQVGVTFETYLVQYDSRGFVESFALRRR
jgi:hypothetical protein